MRPIYTASNLFAQTADTAIAFGLIGGFPARFVEYLAEPAGLGIQVDDVDVPLHVVWQTGPTVPVQVGCGSARE